MKKPRSFDIYLIATVLVFLSITVWVPWSEHKKQLALELSFKMMGLGHTYPKDEKARQELRPVVIEKLVEWRTKLETSEAMLKEAEKQLRSVHGAKNEVVLIASHLREIERLRGEIVTLDDQFYAICATAKHSSFDAEAKASGCRNRRVGGVVSS